jgi:hypothetical protein
MIQAYKKYKSKLVCKYNCCHNHQLEPFGNVEDKDIYWICPNCNTLYQIIISLKEVKK